MSPMSPVQFNTAVALRHCMYKSPPKNYPPLFIVLDRSPIHPNFYKISVKFYAKINSKTFRN